MTKKWHRQDQHPDLIDPTREALIKSKLPFVIENVRAAGLNGTLMLCGSMFNLKVQRHRYFETTLPLILTPPCHHGGMIVAVYGHSGGRSKRDNKQFGGVDTWREAMQIDWMIGDELAEAIPPAYTKFIGGHLLKEIAYG